MTPLSQLAEGHTATIVAISGGVRLRRRLAALGLLPGAQLRMLRNHGPVIVLLRSDRLILGRGVASKVLVAAAAGAPAPSAAKPS